MDQKIIKESFHPNFSTMLQSEMNNGYYVKAILIDHESRYYWALLEKRG